MPTYIQAQLGACAPWSREMVHFSHAMRIVWLLLLHLNTPMADCAAGKSTSTSRLKTSMQPQLPKIHPSRAADLLRQHVSQTAMLGTCYEGASVWEAFPDVDCTWLRCVWSETEQSNIDLWLEPFTPISQGPLSVPGACPRPKGGQLKQSTESQPEIAFIVTMHNNGVMTAQSILELFRTAGEAASAEFIVVDDGSTEDISAALDTGRQLQHLFQASFKYVRNRKPTGYGPANNLGVQFARAKYVALINSDTMVVNGWLRPLLESLSFSNKTGMVGPLLVGHNQLITQAGGLVTADGAVVNLHSGQAADGLPTMMNRRMKVDYLSTVAVVLRREVYQTLKGFDAAYRQGYWTDVDLAMRARQAGLDVLLQPLSVVYHQGGSNPLPAIAEDAQQARKEWLMEVNGQVFWERWGKTLAEAHCSEKGSVDAKAQRLMSPNILYVEEGWPQPERDAGSVRLDCIFRILLEEDYSITYGTTSHFSYTQPLYQTQMRFMGVETWPEMDPEQWPLTINRGSSVKCRFDVIIAAKKSVVERVLPVLRKACPEAPIIFDTVDIQFIRESRAKMVTLHRTYTEKSQPLDTSVLGVTKWLEESGVDNAAMRAFRDAELRLVEEAGLTVVVSEEERSIIRRYLPEARVHVLSLIMPPVPEVAASCMHRQGILFVGSFGHQPNGQAIEHLLDDVLPLLKQELPASSVADFHIHIVGSGNPARLQTLLERHKDILTLHVNLASALLELLFSRVKVFVAPLLVGGGVKGKVLQAMMHGLPVVAYSVAVEGIDVAHGQDALVAQDAQEFAQYVAQLHTDCNTWSRLSQAGLRIIQRGYTYQKAQADMRLLLAAAGMQQQIPKNMQRACTEP